MSGSQALAGPDVSTTESFLLLVSSPPPIAGGAGQKKKADRESQQHLRCWMATPSCDYYSSPAVRLNMANWMSRKTRWGQSHGQPHLMLIRALPARKRRAATCRPQDLVDSHSQLTRVGGGVLNQLSINGMGSLIGNRHDAYTPMAARGWLAHKGSPMQKDEHLCLSLTPQVQRQLHVERGSSYSGQPTVSRRWPPLGGPDPDARPLAWPSGHTPSVLTQK